MTAPALAASCSRFVAESLARNPDWSTDTAWLAPGTPGDVVARVQAALADVDEHALPKALRVLRRREMTRIAIRALAGDAPLDETLGDLSDLADACCAAAVDTSLRRLTALHGTPRDAEGNAIAPIVLGMGKLGGRELNFSSDIDLIFFHTAAGETDGPRPIDTDRFFVRLAQEAGKLLSERTEDGFVFRVDTMLRPFGSAGPMSISIDAAEDYYQTHGREWERYALIKARPVAGDLEAGHRLLDLLRPFVYRRYLDFDAIASLRDLKRRIHDDVVARRVTDDVKLGPGGIREVEFIVQSFQLVRGGQDARLREPSLRRTLRYLGDAGLLDKATAQQLDGDYVFLRRLENAIQMYDDAQTHRLPADADARAALCRALGFAEWDLLRAYADGIGRHVNEEFRRVFAEPERAATETPGTRIAGMAFGTVGVDAIEAALSDSGVRDETKGVAQRLVELARGRLARNLSESAGARLRQLVALVLDDCRTHRHPGETAARVLTVVQAIVGRSTYLTLLDEAPVVRTQLVRLCAASRWITDQIAGSPATLDTLLDPRTLYAPPGRDAMKAELAARLDHVPMDDVEAGMDVLRRYRHEITVRIAAADVADVLPLVKVSDHLTWLGEAVLAAAIARARAELAAQFGEVPGLDGGIAQVGAIAYGKFGGIELGYGSDLDLVFVHENVAPDAESSGGGRRLPAPAWFIRLTHRVIHWLTTLTPAGRAYEVDLELRPSGASGLVCVSMDAFARYQQEKAWTWEHQALSRARFVAGPPALGDQFDALRRAVLSRPRDPDTLRKDVLEMRAKMRAHLDKSGATQWDVKQGAGGMIDIEFITQFLLLRDAHANPRLTDWPDHWRQTEVLADGGSLAPEDRDALIAAYREYRACLHELALQQEPGLVDAGRFRAERADVSARWDRLLGVS
ncbi:MAG TPA: bifunctional [glutamate--ammonia ligase]-adenylyl-L-tyrosine phosphorylase/[glutamate--ammonia-ligase] adenylyltransferase [Nevskiaceae bacterium]|nr:bifunctional [glutamate--ammonia ligase]-adenylyl-L-tyrosine phosphorylase/[glutamate--ammonia-ligase] adenylyltransferase [Nevskiaceae bacterium]